jgi:hypothetical protein
MNFANKVEPRIKRLLLIASMLGAMTSESYADGLKIDCPADEAEAQMTLEYQSDVLKISDGKTSTTLQATFRGAPNEFAIQASGQLDSLMPDLGALDKCLAAGLKSQNTTAKDLDTLTYFLVNCRSETIKTATQQKVQASLVATVGPDEPNVVYLDIDRNYLVPSATTGTLLTIPQWPPNRRCTIVNMP